MGSPLAIADQADCDSNAVHCAWIGGIIPDSQGRYIRATYKGKTTPVICMNNRSFAEILPGQAAKMQGKNKITYQVCNGQGQHCLNVGNDVFKVLKSDGSYVANPKYFKIDLTNFNQNPAKACYSAGMQKLKLDM